jgi:membrane-bound serine protease (ClpP class)
MPLTAAIAVPMLTAGLLLVYWELNRPGLILPGALGLAASLIALASLIHHGNSVATVFILTAVLLLGLDLLRPTHRLVVIAAVVALTLGFFSITPNPVAVLCGILLGAGTGTLTRIAHRARANKRVN